MTHPRTSRSLLLLAALGLAGAQLACVNDWDREPETPRAEWESSASGQATVVAAPQPAAAQPVESVDYDDVDDTDPSAIATFQPVLSPHGVWVDDPYYGTVWVPDGGVVGAGFSPYLSHGHWAYTSEGQYWVSDFEWGWATFHYGRWVWIEGRGWSWIPGARYSPAWVDWRHGGGYVGWGPAYPRHCWRSGYAVWIDPYPTPYVFVPSHQFYHPQPHTVVAPPNQGATLVAGTQPWTPSPGGAPGAGFKGARPFVGPDPKAMGIAPSDVAKHQIEVPNKSKPQSVSWAPAPNSKISPVDKATPTYGKPVGMGPYAKPTPAAPTGPMGGKTTTLPGTVYAPSPTTPNVAPSPGYGSKPYAPPAGTYAPAPKYSPPAGGTYAPAPKYSPPAGGTYAPAPKYSPPASGGFSPKPSAPGPSFGGGGVKPSSKPSVGGFKGAK